MKVISSIFEVAVGSVIGRDHLRPLGWKNNQDGLAVCTFDDAIVAVVTDGCGSEAKSEIGAVIGANLVAETIDRELHELYLGVGRHLDLDRDGYVPISSLPSFWATVRQTVLGSLWSLVSKMGARYRDAIYDHLLFTVNGVVITPYRATFFAIGDGVQIINGVQIPLGPFAQNAPPYLAYALFAKAGESDVANDFLITKAVPLEKVQSILIGTDGVEDLIAAEELMLPGRSEIVCPISQFWEKDRYFENPDGVRRRLALINNEHQTIDWKKQTIERTVGRLPDDTTLIAIRRKH